MYCTQCGEKISENARFCPNCGQRVNEKITRENNIAKRTLKEEQAKNISNRELKEKVFNFGIFTYNKACAAKTNEWLKGKQIEIESIHINAAFKRKLGMETAPSRLVLHYREADKKVPEYRFWFISKMAFIGHNYDTVDREFEKWKSSHPDCRVVYQAHSGHTYETGGTTSIFFFYLTYPEESK